MTTTDLRERLTTVLNDACWQGRLSKDESRAVLDAVADMRMPEPEPECDHPGIEHSFFSYTGVCPSCRKCKFIGHGPLCWECYQRATGTDA